ATSKPNQNKLPDFLKSLEKKFKKSQVFVTGTQILSYEDALPENVRLIRQFDELDSALAHMQLT
ncbi:MAG: hypothetical protein ABJP45_10690, partial [Cyclobacteriaceae bacterium]